jgi:hypothetical protein
MPKDFEDTPKEPSRVKAERKWSNNFVQNEFKKIQKEEAERAAKEAEDEPPAIASIIENEKVDRRQGVIRAQTKFAKDIRLMMEGHSQRNIVLYKLSVLMKLKRLKFAKLKLLEAMVAQQGADR